MEKSNYSKTLVKVVDSDDYNKIRMDICKLLDSNKSENILIMNLRPHFQYDLWFVIATALSQTHLKKLSSDIIISLKKSGIYPAYVPNEIDFSSGWVALDYGELIVHLFTSEKREFYDLEGLWSSSIIEPFKG